MCTPGSKRWEMSGFFFSILERLWGWISERSLHALASSRDDVCQTSTLSIGQWLASHDKAYSTLHIWKMEWLDLSRSIWRVVSIGEIDLDAGTSVQWLGVAISMGHKNGLHLIVHLGVGQNPGRFNRRLILRQIPNAYLQYICTRTNQSINRSSLKTR